MTPDFDPFRAAADSAVTTRCPKCHWAQPPERSSCAACGLIFARYAAAQARASAPPPSLPPSSSATLSSSMSSMPSQPSSFGPGTATAGSIVGSAVSSSVSTLWTLVGLNLIPIAVIAVVAVLAVVGIPSAFKVWSVLTGGTLLLAGAAAVVVGVVAWVLLIRLALTVNVGTMLIVDEHMRTGDNRGAFTALGEGWHHSLRAFGATAAVMLVMAVPVLPLGLLASKSSSAGLVVSAALTLMWIGYVAVRGALVLPAVVLGDRSILGAMQESLELTADRFFGTAAVVVLGGLVMIVVSIFCGAVSWIPVVGQLIGVVGGIVVAGVGSGMMAGLWRDRCDGL